MDRIFIKNLLLRCIIGVNEEERRDKQDVIINISLYGDFKKACSTDNFENAVDYRDITKKVIGLVEKSSFFLVEALAQKIADICLEFPLVEEVEVRVEKPGALRFAESAGVEIRRKK